MVTQVKVLRGQPGQERNLKKGSRFSFESHLYMEGVTA